MLSPPLAFRELQRDGKKERGYDNQIFSPVKDASLSVPFLLSRRQKLDITGWSDWLQSLCISCSLFPLRVPSVHLCWESRDAFSPFGIQRLVQRLSRSTLAWLCCIVSLVQITHLCFLHTLQHPFMQEGFGWSKIQDRRDKSWHCFLKALLSASGLLQL